MILDGIFEFFELGKNFSFKKTMATIRKQPYVEVISESWSEEEGFELKLDWNDIFISKLLEAGVEADEDDEMVQIWLQSIMRTHDIDSYEDELSQMVADEQAKIKEDQDLL